eukprot:IDg16011t1
MPTPIHHHNPQPLTHPNAHRRKQWSHAQSQSQHHHLPHMHHAPPPRRGRNNRSQHSGSGHVHLSTSAPISRSRSNGLGSSGNGVGGGSSGGGGGGGGGSVPSVREFNRRISACARRRDLSGALRVLDDLDRTPGVSRNLFTYNAVINALVICFGGTDDDVSRAFALVKEMEDRGIAADRVTLNSLINACVTAGLLHEAQRVYEQMRARDIEPDDFTFTTLAKAGASQNNVAMLDALLVHQLHHHSTARSRAAAENADGSTANGSANGHSKNSSTHRTSPVAYNTIADAYIRCGHPERALRLLSRLKDLHILQRN